MESVELWFMSTFGEYMWLGLILFAMLPFAEGRLAIPFGLSSYYFGHGSLSPIVVFICSYVGSLIPGIVLILTIKPFLNFLKRSKTMGKLACKIDDYFRRRSESLGNKEKFLKDIGIIMFIGIPLPLTGVWTGSIIASIIGIPTPRAIIDVSIGNLMSCLIVMLVSTVLREYIDILIIVLVCMMVVCMVYTICKMLVHKRAKN